MKKYPLKVLIALTVYLSIYSCVVAQPEVQKAKQEKINDELFYTKISAHVFMITHYFPYWGGNSLIVFLKNKQAVLIDTPYDGLATEALVNWINDNFGEHELFAIVTGFHQDNLGGNEFLIEKGIPVYGMQLTSQLLEKEKDSLKLVILESVAGLEDKSYYKRYSDLEFTPPNHTFDLKKGEAKILEIGNGSFTFFYPGESHTADNSVVYFHNENILFGGCMIRAMEDVRPGYIGYANMKEWPRSVESVLKKFPETSIVIPGHGLEGGPEMIQHTINLLDNWNKNMTR